MICCIECFLDQEIRYIIRSQNMIGNCEVCGTSSAYICDTSILKEPFESLLSIYSPVSMFENEISIENRIMLKDALKNNWNIFSIDETKIQNIITQICNEKFVESPELFTTPVTIPESNDTEYLKSNTILRNTLWEDFVYEIKHKHRFHMENKINLEILDHYFQNASTSYSKNHVFYRARLTDQNIPYQKSEMGAPSKEKNYAGRANPKGITVLYLSGDIETTIYEMRALKYDFVSVGTFKLTTDINIFKFNELGNISPFSVYDITEYAINKEALEKFSIEIAKPLRRQDSELDYLPTQYLTEYVKSKNFDGIEYGSTLKPDGINLAIFNEEKCKCVKSEIYEITNLKYEYE